MYLAYYNLQEKPFQITTDPRFLWLGEKHQEALATLNYGLLDNKGFLLLTGDVGTGKTTLIKALVQNLGEGTIFATVVSPLSDKMEFFNYLAAILGMRGEFKTKVDFLTRFTRFLNEAHQNDKTVLLIIDEAQSLSIELLEEIRLLSNIEKDNKKLLNIFFVGQDEFNDLLMEKSCRALRQRITITYHIMPLAETETREYVRHRLKVAGTGKEIFNNKTIREIQKFSKGYPRLINIICDHALLTGYVKEKKVISPAMIRECAEELSLPGERRPTVQQKNFKEIPRKSNRIGKAFVYCGLTAVVLLGLYVWSLHGSSFSPLLNDAWKKISLIVHSTTSPPQATLPTAPDTAVKHRTTVPEVKAQENIVTEPEKIRDEASEVHKDSGQTDFSEGTVVAVFGDASETTVKPVQTQGQRSSVQKSSPPPTGPQEKSSEAGVSDTGKKPQRREKNELVLRDGYKMTVPFKYDTNSLSTEAFEDLDRLSASLIRNNEYQIFVRGYTDGIGNRHYNMKLSEFRANMVASYLTGSGISPSRIRVIAMADDNPLGSNNSTAGRAANRRVEIEVRAIDEKPPL